MQGTILPPFESWLLIRGLRTLGLRWDRACENALKIAQHFEGHPKIEAALYPGLASHPGHELAKTQMTRGFGGMLSLLVKGGADAGKSLAASAKIFLPATSLGGVESLIEHRLTIEGPDWGVAPNLVRLSVGIEDCDDLIEDLENALR